MYYYRLEKKLFLLSGPAFTPSPLLVVQLSGFPNELKSMSVPPFCRMKMRFA